jgi:hypothetical protein
VPTPRRCPISCTATERKSLLLETNVSLPKRQFAEVLNISEPPQGAKSVGVLLRAPLWPRPATVLFQLPEPLEEKPPGPPWPSVLPLKVVPPTKIRMAFCAMRRRIRKNRGPSVTAARRDRAEGVSQLQLEALCGRLEVELRRRVIDEEVSGVVGIIEDDIDSARRTRAAGERQIQQHNPEKNGVSMR